MCFFCPWHPQASESLEHANFSNDAQKVSYDFTICSIFLLKDLLLKLILQLSLRRTFLALPLTDCLPFNMRLFV